MGPRRQLRAIALLPGMGAVVVPAALVGWRGANVGWGLSAPLAALVLLLGAALVAGGLVLVVQTIALLGRDGHGTLAPWDPTSRLVVRGPYRRVRNPMISGVLAILLGEAVVLGSPAVLAWAAVFLLANALWLPLVEERGLLRRFGDDYARYRAHVPRWVPRARAWTPTER
ncbi:MAG TPA: isoprenylcysteine carboxylmethyltransferase family protein [Conexibacter sp.]|nr:isoprenylcysteine carboxylmethyltransferase family protein [Conexibacter sp.]